jgi:uncharacterized protein GlcG (DUF336 family)
MVELSESDIQKILGQAQKAASTEKSLLRIDKTGNKSNTKMHIVIVDRGGRVIGQKSMDDAWIGSISIAKAKAFTAVAFSSNENALSTRSIGVLSQPGQPLWQIGNSNTPEGIIEFPGGLPIYKKEVLVGAIGVSGDGVDQDENVAIAGTKGFEPDESIRIDIVTDKKVSYVG